MLKFQIDELMHYLMAYPYGVILPPLLIETFTNALLKYATSKESNLMFSYGLLKIYQHRIHQTNAKQ